MPRFFLLLGLLNVLFAQKTLYLYDIPARTFEDALEMFRKEQYASALPLFREYLQLKNRNQLYAADAAFYVAACGIELQHRDGEWNMKEFLRKNNETSLRDVAYYYLIKSSFRKKKYHEIPPLFKETDISMLDDERQHELKFKAAYSFFMLHQDSLAKPLFYEVKNENKKYSTAATYYYAFLNYNEKNYTSALADFEKLVNDETFGKSVPFYITQIHFLCEHYSEVVKKGPQLLEGDSIGAAKTQEICRMIGLSHFKLNEYEKAIPWLKKSGIPEGASQENYVMGYCLYHTGKYKEAIPYFEKAVQAEDSLSQNASYHLAGCHLKEGNKNMARNAFYGAWKYNKVSGIAEDALYQYALLSHELDMNPFNESIRAFQQYLKQYPNSYRRNEVIKMLSRVYATTHNYPMAIESIEKIDPMDPLLKSTWQKLVYNYGVELMNNKNLSEAEKQFRKSQKIFADPRVNALTLYRLGELAWQQKSYSAAIEHWKNFQVTEGAAGLPEYVTSNYHLGYAFLYRKEKDDYEQANIHFRKFLLQAPEENEEQKIRKADAALRAGDALFMNKRFELAIDPYSQGIQMNKLDQDYALLQRAICFGLTRKYDEKIKDLQQLQKNYPNSPYIQRSQMELANTWLENKKDPDKAMAIYKQIIKDNPDGRMAMEAYARLGNIHYARKEDDKALQYFDLYLRKDQSSEEAKNIMEQVKAIYKAKGDIAGMEKYFASIGNPLEENQLEKTAYDNAREAYYDKKDFAESKKRWAQYIERFPNGKYINEANYCMGNIFYDEKNYESAIPYFKAVDAKGRSIYSEDVLSKLSWIYYQKKDYRNALVGYSRLNKWAEQPANQKSSRWGMMRSAFFISSCDTALSAAREIQNVDKLSPQEQNEVKYIRMVCLYKLKSYQDFLAESKNFHKSIKSVQGAEILYYTASAHRDMKNYKECENTINVLLSYQYSNDYWNNMAMLLLAEMYLDKEEFSNADYILKALLDTNPPDDIKNKAQALMQKLTELRDKKVQSEIQRTPFNTETQNSENE
ncbi:MAG: tetratricopeptide repeat protein [Bacteroidia bacterium]|nr:tetratricopeptide repeat protein [Bacteroidia bacterium]